MADWNKDEIAFKVFDMGCPECGQQRLIGYYFFEQNGRYQHTHYVCTWWPHPGERCGWHGWVVPDRVEEALGE